MHMINLSNMNMQGEDLNYTKSADNIELTISSDSMITTNLEESKKSSITVDIDCLNSDFEGPERASNRWGGSGYASSEDDLFSSRSLIHTKLMKSPSFCTNINDYDDKCTLHKNNKHEKENMNEPGKPNFRSNYEEFKHLMTIKSFAEPRSEDTMWINKCTVFPVTTHLSKARMQNESLRDKILKESNMPLLNSKSNATKNVPKVLLSSFPMSANPETKHKTAKSAEVNTKESNQLQIKDYLLPPGSKTSTGSIHKKEGSSESTRSKRSTKHQPKTMRGKCWMSFKKTAGATYVRRKWRVFKKKLAKSEQFNSTMFVLAIVAGIVFILCIVILPIIKHPRKSRGVTQIQEGKSHRGLTQMDDYY